MTHLTIKFGADSDCRCCGLCGRATTPRSGPALFLEANAAALCRECGRKQAPSLAALLDLAEVAQRVGRVARHTLVPSLETLLDLARAAENYTFAASDDCRPAA